MSANNFDDIYDKKIKIYARGLKYIDQDLRNLIEDLRKSGLFRAKVATLRVKDIQGVKRKAVKNRIQPDKIFGEIKDIIGIRIITNSIVDIYKLLTKIMEHPNFIIIEEENKLLNPDFSGYRALHIVIEYNVIIGTNTEKVLCEIQIRTLLQEAWAEIVHDDIYKHSEEIPQLLGIISKTMSDFLYTIDNLGEKLIEEAQRVIKSNRIEGTEINKPNLAFIYFEKFGYYPEEFTLQGWLNYLREVGIDSISKVKEYFPNEDIKMKFNSIYEEYFPERGGISDDDFLIFGTKGMIDGKKAFKEFKSMLKEEQEDIALYHREILSDMPETIEEFMDLFVMRDKDDDICSNIYGYLEALGAIESCARCGTDFVNLDRAVEGILDYYGEDEDKWNISSHIFDNCEIGETYCNYCEHIMSKDD
jgi:putative GTP pyrophosphokinase